MYPDYSADTTYLVLIYMPKVGTYTEVRTVIYNTWIQYKYRCQYQYRPSTTYIPAQVSRYRGTYYGLALQPTTTTIAKLTYIPSMPPSPCQSYCLPRAAQA